MSHVRHNPRIGVIRYGPSRNPDTGHIAVSGRNVSKTCPIRYASRATMRKPNLTGLFNLLSGLKRGPHGQHVADSATLSAAEMGLSVLLSGRMLADVER